MPRGGQVGNKGGQKGRSGRRPKAEELGVTRLLDKCWKDEQRRQVVEALHEQAAKGNVPAAQLLLAYAFGKPTEKHEHAGSNGGPITVRVVYDQS